MEKTTLYGPKGIELVLDPREICIDNPGNGCPALVRYKGGTASYNCATNEGEVTNGHIIRIPDNCIDWLYDQDDEIEAMYEEFYAERGLRYP